MKNDAKNSSKLGANHRNMHKRVREATNVAASVTERRPNLTEKMDAVAFRCQFVGGMWFITMWTHHYVEAQDFVGDDRRDLAIEFGWVPVWARKADGHRLSTNFDVHSLGLRDDIYGGQAVGLHGGPSQGPGPKGPKTHHGELSEFPPLEQKLLLQPQLQTTQTFLRKLISNCQL